MRIIRVFPRRTSFTPTDDFAFVGYPPLLRPEADEVHISVCFTWDMQKAQSLVSAWGHFYPVAIGGPALGSPVDRFIPGMYIKEGVTFTSRGCPSHCPYCLVPPREGPIQVYSEFAEGHIIQDNNLLATGQEHMGKVFTMLRKQKRAAVFSGGLKAALVDDWVANELKSVRIAQAFFSCDRDVDLLPLKRAKEKLEWLPRDKLRCYVLFGFQDESLEVSEVRCKKVWGIGFMPFAQLYQPPDHWIQYPIEWRRAARTWCRPAVIKAIMKEQGS